jgi:hypothetical protein
VSASSFAAPDGIEPIIGWRYWRADTGWLCSLNRLKTWPAGRALEARCSLSDAGASHEEPPPGERCGCGIYAATHLEILKEIVHPDLDSPLIVGEVALWGRIVPAQLGFRAQYAYPRRLWIIQESTTSQEALDGLLFGIAEMYRIPVEGCDAAWAVSTEEVNRWQHEPRVAEIRTAVSAFREVVERLAAALAQGEDAYREELARVHRQEWTHPLARSAARGFRAFDEP